MKLGSIKINYAERTAEYMPYRSGHIGELPFELFDREAIEIAYALCGFASPGPNEWPTITFLDSQCRIGDGNWCMHKWKPGIEDARRRFDEFWKTIEELLGEEEV